MGFFLFLASDFKSDAIFISLMIRKDHKIYSTLLVMAVNTIIVDMYFCFKLKVLADCEPQVE